MATRLLLDSDLVRAAQEIGRHRTATEAVTAALKEYVRHRKQLELRELFGTIDYAWGYNHKPARRR